VLFWLPGAVRERRLHEELTDAGVRYPVATAIHGAGNPAEAVWWLHRWQGRRLRLASWTVKTRTRRLSPGDVGGYTRFSAVYIDAYRRDRRPSLRSAGAIHQRNSIKAVEPTAASSGSTPRRRRTSAANQRGSGIASQAAA
jgi:hypothetical protein